MIAGEERWLVIARNALDPDEVKYFLSNAPEDTPLATLLHIAFSRWHVERSFQESQTEVGLDHYEGRTWLGLVRHLVISAASILFLAEQRQRLRRLRGEAAQFTLEQIKLATEVQLEPGVPPAERQRRLTRALEIIRYHQRRKEVARRSHTKTRLRLLEEKRIDLPEMPRCPVAL